MLFKAFSSLLCPPPPPPSSTLTADDFATFFINKMTNLTAQFSTPQSVKHILPANINLFTCFSPLSEDEVSKLTLSSHPTTCPLDPIHLISCKLFLLQLFLHSITSLTHPFTLEFSPSAFKQARITPLKKPTLNPTLLGNYRPVSLLPFIAKTLERVVQRSLLAGLPANSIKPLQLIQNAAARLIFNEPKRTHVTPLFIKFALATNICSKFITSDLCASRSLRSTSEQRITVPSQRGTKSVPQTFSLTISTWNDLPNSIPAAESLPIYKKWLKTHIFHLYLTL